MVSHPRSFIMLLRYHTGAPIPRQEECPPSGPAGATTLGGGWVAASRPEGLGDGWTRIAYRPHESWSHTNRRARPAWGSTLQGHCASDPATAAPRNRANRHRIPVTPSTGTTHHALPVSLALFNLLCYARSCWLTPRGSELQWCVWASAENKRKPSMAKLIDTIRRLVAQDSMSFDNEDSW